MLSLYCCLNHGHHWILRFETEKKVKKKVFKTTDLSTNKTDFLYKRSSKTFINKKLTSELLELGITTLRSGLFDCPELLELFNEEFIDDVLIPGLGDPEKIQKYRQGNITSFSYV